MPIEVMPPHAALANRPLRWGILGTGRIAKDFCAALVAAAPTNTIAVIAGRSPRAAAQLATTYGGRSTTAEGARAYDELVGAADVDIVYIATVHTMHKEHILLCLAAGKHVLCEKPMCVDASETRLVVAAARKAGLLLVEGHWTYAWPAAIEAWKLIDEGYIGELASVTSDFTYPAPIDSACSVFQNEAGGGASLVLGVYPMCAALRAFGRPEHVHAAGTIARPTPAGAVDTQVQVSMRFSGGKTALATYGWAGAGAQTTVFVGSKGRLTLREPAHAPTQLHVQVQTSKRNEYTEEVRDFPKPAHPPHLPPLIHPNSEGFLYEVKAVEATLRAGLTECALMPPQASVRLAEAIDAVRAQLGVTYAQDRLAAKLRAAFPRLCAAAPLGTAVVTGVLVGIAICRAAARSRA